MRKVGNFKDQELSDEQYFVLMDFIASTKDLVEAEALIKILLTESEIAVISQRLAILRMIAKNFTYSEIEEKIKASTNTIAKVVNSKAKEKTLEKYFDQMLKRYRYNPAKYQKALEKLYPEKLPTAGVGIRAFLREQERDRKRLQKKSTSRNG